MLKRSMFSLFLSVALAGCECGARISRVAPELGVDDASIDFGLVALDEVHTQTLRLKALTSADVAVVLRLEDDAGAFELLDPVPTLVPGSGFVDVKIAFVPRTAEVFAATLDIQATDVEAARSRHRVLLSGQGQEARVAVEPSAIALSATGCPALTRDAQCEATAVVTVRNMGLVALRVESVAFEEPAVARLELAKPFARKTLVAGESLDVTLRWSPAEAQAGRVFETRLEVRSNDREQPLVAIPIRAEALANAPPAACIEVISVTRRAYELDDDGRPVLRRVPVSRAEWWDDEHPGKLRVRPGDTVRASTGPSAGDERCTFDPEGGVLTREWRLEGPVRSRSAATPVAAEETGFEIDAAGEYELTLTVADSLGQRANAALSVTALSEDDLFVELSWESDEPAPDLDLHLLADAGPWTRTDGATGTYGDASLFCEQDTFFYNPHPELFDERTLRDNPRFLRDDQGSAGRLESITLADAPPGSEFRVAVHYFGGENRAEPSLAIRLRGEEFGPFRPPTPLERVNDVWFGARIAFPADGGAPDIIPLDTWANNEAPVRVGVCE